MPGPRILVTRSPKQSSALADRLRELGAEPVLIPTIEIADPASFAPLDAALAELTNFDWLLFTSANAVEAMHARLKSDPNRPSSPSDIVILSEAKDLLSTAVGPGNTAQGGIKRPRIAAIGPATARALAQIGLTPDLLPPQAVAESFAEALLPHARRADGSSAKFLLIRAEEAREHLPETLRAAGAEVTVAPAYRTVVPAAFIPRMRALFSTLAPGGEQAIAAATFTSASTVRNLFTMLDAAGATLPPDVVRASIGPITSAALDELGFPPHVQAPQATVESLAENLVKYLQGPESL